MSNLTISVIVPVYNVEQYVDECISSIVNQSYRELEIILVDDGSTDGSSAKCDAWQSKDIRIKTIHTSNYGVSHARNVGLDVAHGDYVGFVDGDDWLEPDMYEILLHELLDKKADISGGGYIREYANGGVITLRKEKPKTYAREEILQEIFSFNDKKLLHWELCDKLFKKELVTEINLAENIAKGEDMLYLWKVMKQMQNFAYVPLFKYHYRMREGSVSHSKISNKTISIFWAVKTIWRDCESETAAIKKVIWKQYAIRLVSETRAMLWVDAEKYRATIKENQKIIRCNIGKFIGLDSISYRVMLGVMFLCLPYSVCNRLKYLTAKRSD